MQRTNSIDALDSSWGKLERSGWLAERLPEVRARLRGVAQGRHYPAGEVIYGAGDIADGVYGLAHGALDVSIPRVDGEVCVIHRAVPGFWVGDLALFAESARLVGLRAAACCEMVFLPRAALEHLVREDCSILGDFYQLTHQNVATTLHLLGNLAVIGAENRVALRLLLQSERATHDEEDWVHISQQELAQLVALSEQSVRRALHSLEQQALIEIGYRRVRIADRARLEGLCGFTGAAEPQLYC